MPSPARSPRFSPSGVRDSTASGGFTSIGNMLSSPYDEDQEDNYEQLRTPMTPQPDVNPFNPAYPSDPNTNVQNATKPRIGKVREPKYSPPGKESLMKRIKSFEGEMNTDRDVGNRDSMYSDEGEGDGNTVLAFDKPSPGRQVASKTGTRVEGNLRPVSIVHFPQPTFISPVKSNEPIRHSPSPIRPRVQIPHSASTPSLAPQTPRKGVNDGYDIPRLPCSGTPVSPHLALPPLTPPKTPFANNTPGFRGSVTSISSETSLGYDVMKEKKALFREGQEELMTPFSPRKTRQESGPRQGPRKGLNRGVSTVDFWKRFSVSVRLDQVAQANGKESAWLSDAQTRRRKIRWIALSVLLAVVVVAAAIAIIIVVVQNNS